MANKKSNTRPVLGMPAKKALVFLFLGVTSVVAAGLIMNYGAKKGIKILDDAQNGFDA